MKGNRANYQDKENTHKKNRNPSRQIGIFNNENKKDEKIIKIIHHNDIKIEDNKVNINDITINKNQNNQNIGVQEINNKKPFKEEIIKIFIYIFYYEQNLSNNKYNSFDYREKYYLINPEWIVKFKNYYNYEKCYDLFKNIKKKNKFINYNNIEKYFGHMNNELNNINIEEKELSKDLSDLKKINCGIKKKNNISYIFKGLIFPSKIIEQIKNLIKNLKNLPPKELYFKNDSIIYINKPKKIIIGNLNDYNLFIPKYVFEFISDDILEKEKEIILSYNFSIDEYIKNTIPIENKNKNFRVLKNENNEEIYKLIISINTNNNRRAISADTKTRGNKLNTTKENGESPNKNLPKGKDNIIINKDKRTIKDIKIENVKGQKEKEYLNEIEKNKKTINELNQFKFKMEKN